MEDERILMQSVCDVKIAYVVAAYRGEELTFCEPNQLHEVRKDTAPAFLPT